MERDGNDVAHLERSVENANFVNEQNTANSNQ